MSLTNSPTFLNITNTAILIFSQYDHTSLVQLCDTSSLRLSHSGMYTFLSNYPRTYLRIATAIQDSNLTFLLLFCYQMGSKMKPVIFSDQVASALKGWHQTAKKQLKHGQKSGSNTPFSSRPGTPLNGSLSPIYLLRGHPNYHDSIENGLRPLSPRGSSFGNEGWGGAEGVPLSPHQHEIEIEDFTRSSTPNQSEIERDLEDPEVQHTVRGSLNDFSFRDKQASK